MYKYINKKPVYYMACMWERDRERERGRKRGREGAREREKERGREIEREREANTAHGVSAIKCNAHDFFYF